MQMHEYMQACMDSWESRKASLDEQEGFGNLAMDGWMDGWMNGWMDGFLSTPHVYFFSHSIRLIAPAKPKPFSVCS